MLRTESENKYCDTTLNRGKQCSTACLQEFLDGSCVTGPAQLPAERLLGDGVARVLPKYPLRQVDQPPADHAMNRRDRAALDHLGDYLALAIIELGGLVRRLSIQQTLRALRVEP